MAQRGDHRRGGGGMAVNKQLEALDAEQQGRLLARAAVLEALVEVDLPLEDRRRLLAALRDAGAV